MDESELTRVVGQIRTLVEEHYLFPDVAAVVSRVLADRLAEGRYPAEARSLATAVTADLQSVNGDKHLRLLYHEQALPQRTPGDDSEEYAAMARWAGTACGGVACLQRLAGNVGYLDLQPVLFPAAISGGEHHRRDDPAGRHRCAHHRPAPLPGRRARNDRVHHQLPVGPRAGPAQRAEGT